MHSDNASSGDVRDEKAELLDSDAGTWLVVTKYSVHRFDLDARTVVRHPGPGATDFGDIILPTDLEIIEWCRVGERGRWRFHPRDHIMQPSQYLSSVIVRIVRADPKNPAGADR